MIKIQDSAKEQKYIDCMKSSVRGQTNVKIISGDLEWNSQSRTAQRINLLPYPYVFTEAVTVNGLTLTPNIDGTVSAKGTPTQLVTKKLQTVYDLPNKNLVFAVAGNKELAEGVLLTADLYKNGKYVTSMSSSGYVPTVVVDNTDNKYDSSSFYIRFYPMPYNITLYPQLEIGTNPTPYTPYLSPYIAEKPIQSVEIKRDIDPLGRELPSISLEWEEICVDGYSIDYVNNLTIGQKVNLTIIQDVSENFDNSETVELQYPVLFLSQTPEITDTTIKYKAVDIVTLTNDVTIAKAFNLSNVKAEYTTTVKDSSGTQYWGTTSNAETILGTTAPKLKNIIANILLDVRKMYMGNEVIMGILGTIADNIQKNQKQDTETGEMVTDIAELETIITTPLVVKGQAWDCIKNLLVNVNMYIDFVSVYAGVVRLKRYFYLNNKTPYTDFYTDSNSDRNVLRLVGLKDVPTTMSVAKIGAKATFNSNGWAKKSYAYQTGSTKTETYSELPLTSYDYIGTTDTGSYVMLANGTNHTGGSFYLLFFASQNPVYEFVMLPPVGGTTTTIDNFPSADGVYVLVYTTFTQKEFENSVAETNYICYAKEAEQANTTFDEVVDFGSVDGDVYEENNDCNFLTSGSTEMQNHISALPFYYSGWAYPNRITAEITHAGDYTLEPSDIVTATIIEERTKQKKITGVIVSTDLKWQGYTEEKITIHEWSV